VGKHLLKFVWEQLDAIEQANPGSMIPWQDHAQWTSIGWEPTLSKSSKY
jgi:hypothetical protein